ncbi:unnamed protein product, partial [Effrenium voratum]
VIDFEDKHGLAGLTSEAGHRGIELEYHAITNGIFNQHRGTMLDVAKGVFEFNEDLNKLFGPDLELAELRHLQLIQDIEESLDEFFTNRLTLRLMISHIQALNANKNVNSDGEAMVGVVNVSTHPITILSRAYVATRFMCMRDFQRAPDLLVNGTMHDEYVLRQARDEPQIGDDFQQQLQWDTLCAVLLIFVAVLTPFEAGFLEGEPLSFIGAFNIVTNVFFLMDMVMQFFIAFPIETRYGPRWVQQKRLIAIRYLQGWFLIDLASTAPLDYLSPGSGLGLLRTIRMLRLLKLLRLARGVRVVRRYQAEFGMSYRKSTLYFLFFSVLAVSHWLACTLGIIHKFQMEGEVCSALDLDADLQGGCSTSWLTEGLRPYGGWDWAETPQIEVFDAYVMAFYTGITILVHPHAYDATGTGERLFFTLLLLIGGFMWTQVISRSTAIASSLNAHQLAHQQTMDDLNTIADRLNLSRDMKIRLRKFFLRSTAQHEYEAWQKILNRMSPQLRRDTYREVNVHWVKKVRFFDKCSTSFLTCIAEILEIRMFGEQEHFGQLFHMYIMMGGAASRVTNFSILVPGTVWGEDHLLLSNPDLVASNIAVSLTVVEVQELVKSGFDAVLDNFPEHAAVLRQIVVKYIVIRGVKRLAAITLEERDRERERQEFTSASPSSAWNKQLWPENEADKRKALKKGDSMDEVAASIADGARLINMQYNAAKRKSSGTVGEKRRKEKHLTKRAAPDAGAAAAVAWYSPMDAAAAATAAAVSAADSKLGDKVSEWSSRQDDLEETLHSRLDEISEQIYGLWEMMQEQQELMMRLQLNQVAPVSSEQHLRSSSLTTGSAFRTLPAVPRKPDSKLCSHDHIPVYT